MYGDLEYNLGFMLSVPPSLMSSRFVTQMADDKMSSLQTQFYVVDIHYRRKI